MKKSLMQLYKSIRQHYPLVEHLVRRMRYLVRRNSVRSEINGKNNRINHNGSLLSSVSIDIIGDNNVIEIKSSCILNSVIFYIRGNNHSIRIGAGCTFNQGGSIWLEDSGCALDIGAESSFEHVHLAVTESGSSMKIGRDCMFAYDIDVRTGDSHSIIDINSRARINYAKDVSIGNHVWVAAHCVILKGAIIPNESVVATGSVVTRQFSQPGIVIAGNPAQVVKEGVTWLRERV
jgi:acetyltransferase-like isoleucine patch superfamily enzyme